MGSVIGQLLPLAVGIAISPLPIVAAILMLLSPRAKSTGLGFLVGWLLGIAVATTVFVLLSSVLPDESGDTSQPIRGAIQIVLGVGLLLLAVKQWRSRPRPGTEPKMPAWMASIDQMTAAKALGLGFLLSGVNPKNLLIAASAGVTIGAAALSGGDAALVILVFVVLAGSPVLIAVIGYLIASTRLGPALERTRTWLTAENAVIMSVVLFVLGVVLIGKGLDSF